MSALPLLGLGLLLALARSSSSSSSSSSPASQASPKPTTPNPRPSPVTPKPTGSAELLIGDSLGVGLAGPLRAHLPSLHTTATNGTTIDHWAALATPGEHSIAQGARLVLVSLGTNDIASGADAEPKRAKIAKIVETCRAAGAKVGWIGPPSLPWPGYGVRAVLAQECGRLAIPLFDTEGAFTFGPGERAPDGVHATSSGYARWAAAIAAWLPGVGLSPN